MNDPAVKTENLTKKFGKNVAIDSLSIEAPRGKVFGFLGPNGSGKTTTIRMLLGLLHITKGDARVLGIDSRKEALPIRRKVGYVPEERIFYDWMTVKETARFSSAFYPTWDAELEGALIRKFNLEPGKKIKELSKGMRAKVSLLLALSHKPELLILDEPTGGLDVRVRHEFLESIVEMAEEGRTVFISSHLVSEVERVADIIGILRENHLVICEKQDVLKQKVRAITLRFESEGTRQYERGDLLQIKRSPREDYIVLHSFSDGLVKSIKEKLSPKDIEVSELSLEEIFLAYTDERTPE